MLQWDNDMTTTHLSDKEIIAAISNFVTYANATIAGQATEIERLNRLLAQREPVAIYMGSDEAAAKDLMSDLEGLNTGTKLFTVPLRELSDDDIAAVARTSLGYDGSGFQQVHSGDLNWFARAILKKAVTAPLVHPPYNNFGD
jgi:hypothetical protein